MKRLLLVFFWLPATLTTISVSLIFFNYRWKAGVKQIEAALNLEKLVPGKIYSALPEVLGLSTLDPTKNTIQEYLNKYRSPMRDTAKALAQTAQEFEVDPFLMLAIAQCETNLGRKSPEGCYNPFGLGIYGKRRLCFEDWEGSYFTMAKTLKTKYLDQGMRTPEEIMEKYCPASIEKAGGSWAKCVNRFYTQIQELHQSTTL